MVTDSSQVVEVLGVVIPTQWDKRGNIIQVAIQSDNFEKYLVDDDQNITLLNMMDKKIHVRGFIIGEDVMGQKIIEINWINNEMSQ